MIRRLLPWLVLLVAAGCTPHAKTPVELPVEPPAAYLEQYTPTDLPPFSGRWWLDFADPELNRLIGQLLAQNLEISQALARLEQLEAALGVANSSLSPTLGADARASRSSQPGIQEDLIGNASQWSIAASYEVDLWGKLASRRKAAQLDLEAGKLDVETIFLGLTARLAELYFRMIEARALLNLADGTIASTADTMARVEERYRRGLVPAVDLYQARQSHAAALAVRPLYEAGLAQAEHAIAVLLGGYPGRMAGGPDRLPDAPPLFDVDVPASLIARRPDLQASLQRIAVADAQVAAAVAERFPSLSLTGSYGALRQDVAAGLLTGDFWSLLGNLAAPIVDGGRRRAEIERTRALLREAVAAYQQNALVAFREVEDALAGNRTGEARLEQLEAVVAATGATLRLAEERYLHGITDYLPVLTAQRFDYESRSRFIEASRQLLSERISLARALGGGWMREEMGLRWSAEKERRQ